MKIQFLGAAETSSGSCYLLSFAGKQVLIDCGLFHGPQELKERNYGGFPFQPAQIDALILTHAHVDHSGLLPKLAKHGFRGPIYATGATADLCAVLLADSASIQESEVARKNRKRQRRGEKLLSPIYTVQDAHHVQTLFRRMIYDEEILILPGLRLRLRDAGHILGAAILELWVEEEGETLKIVFSGDLGNLDQPIVQDPSFISSADILIVESTYATRLHERREERFSRLAEVVNEVGARGGNLLIPAFALGRTQDLLYALRALQDEGAIAPATIYLDSPLAKAATEVFSKHAQVFDYETRGMLAQGRSPFQFPGLHYTESAEQSIRLNSIPAGLIIIAASGMADAGRIKHHLRHNLWRPQAGVLLLGYQAAGTLGRFLQDGAEMVRIHGEEVLVRASVHTISGFSAHADQKALFHWLRRFRYLGQVFTTHGDLESCHAFARRIASELHIPARAPKLDQTFDLRKGQAPRLLAGQAVAVEAGFSGVIQAFKSGRSERQGVWGFTHKALGVKNTMATAFNLGSGRRLFAEIALYRLVEEGALAEEDFSTWHWQELEEVIAKVTGKRSSDFIEAEILTPLQLAETAFYFLDELPPGAARGYTYNSLGAEVENVYEILKEGWLPWLFSTAHDLQRLWSSLLKGRLLKPPSLQKLLQAYASPGREGLFELQGVAPGARIFLAALPARDLFFLVLSNGEKGAASAYHQLVQGSLES